MMITKGYSCSCFGVVLHVKKVENLVCDLLAKDNILSEGLIFYVGWFTSCCMYVCFVLVILTLLLFVD